MTRGAPYTAPPSPYNAPNAALLIDFDNVTMGIRSDLGKELKALLNSDVIRGKVAVQRAYADWRRYPQYIVPLAESSIDLIFAPAYGTSKKNATDLRMAIDAMELVFIRPEIGTFILLTGDSDFSSCVLKLKEYGKYVIGVGMRESSSDLLIQNCDEYYSYHALSGLTRAGSEEGVREDPWTLVERAVKQMATNRDAMRTDRLKQVMIDLDSGFDEKKLGYSKFSRFVTDAAAKGLIALRRGENGQHEVMVPGDEGSRESAAEARTEAGSSDRPRRNGRRGGRSGRPEPSLPAPQPIVAAEAAAEEGDAEPSAPESAPESMPEPISTPEPRPQPAGTAAGPSMTELEGAYALLQHAVRGMGRGGQRDGEVKRKMMELVPGFDEGAFGFSKFSRFLREAHEAEVVDLLRQDDGSYEVSLTAGGKRLPAPAVGGVSATPPPDAATDGGAEAEDEQPAERAGRGRGRRGRRGGTAAEAPPALLPGQAVAVESDAPVAGEEEVEPAADSEAAAAPAVPTDAATAEQPAPAARVSIRGRRGSRGRGAPADAPPPLLPGQVVATPSSAASEPQAPAPEPAGTVQPSEPGQPEGEAPAKRPRPRGRKKAAPQAAPSEPAFDAAALQLPSDAAAVRAYLTNRYRGVGAKTADALTTAFGADVFQAMQMEPQRVREALGDRRANTLLEQWGTDFARRSGSDGAAASEVSADDAALPMDAAPAEDEGGATRARRRGGRGRGRGKKDQPATA